MRPLDLLPATGRVERKRMRRPTHHCLPLHASVPPSRMSKCSRRTSHQQRLGRDITVAADMIASVEERGYEYGFVIVADYQPAADHLHGAEETRRPAVRRNPRAYDRLITTYPGFRAERRPTGAVLE